MDALSQLVATLVPRGRMDLRCLFGPQFSAPHDGVGPWRAPFHVVLRGTCELWLPDTDESVMLQAGSLLVLPRGAAHVLRGAMPGTTRARPAKARLIEGGVVDLKTNLAEPAGADIEILCGEFEFAGRRRSALLDALPTHLVLAFGGRDDVMWIDGLVRLMAHEIEQPGPGSAVIVAELSGTLFTLAVRAHLAAQPAQAGVLALMRNLRLAPALDAMLTQPERPWTVASMGALCHMSRANFARAFARHTGDAPLSMLTALRMECAARLLRQGGRDTGSIGESVGYRSEAAFNRAFSRHAGMAPGRFRQSSMARNESSS